MKHDWKTNEKAYYLPKNKPEPVEVPAFRYFMLDGQGNPNGEAFGEAVAVLYSLAYAVKMSPKRNAAPQGYFEYTLFPLEGVWTLTEYAKTLDHIDKDELKYTVMIRQPEFVTVDVARQVIDFTKKKKPSPLLESVRFGTVTDGLCVQMLHVGSYDNEPASFALMEDFCAQNGFARLSKDHREIYLGDPRKSAPEKRRTVLRFRVETRDK